MGEYFCPFCGGIVYIDRASEGQCLKCGMTFIDADGNLISKLPTKPTPSGMAQEISRLCSIIELIPLGCYQSITKWDWKACELCKSRGSESCLIEKAKKFLTPEFQQDVQKLRAALEDIKQFGLNNSGRGYSCARKAEEALK